ncbi:hypothetical protein EV361DRAFT_955152 [Lentinula raphanica]|nr:hypothetical protein EV361DRAFT_955152 [Lentinula raphanica]
MNIVDLVNEVEFVRSEWIGVGKKYQNVPMHVAHACLREKQVPKRVQDLYPAHDLSMSDFASLHIPSQSRELASFHHAMWFSTQKPMISEITCYQLVWGRSIPSKNTLRSLEDAFGQKFLDGAASFVDPRYPKTVHYLPLWVITLWKDLSSLADKQHELRHTLSFIRQAVLEPCVSNHYPDVESILDSRGWNVDVVVGGWTFPSFKFTQLLRPVMLCDDMTQVMTQVLQCRLESNESLKHQHIIAASRFYMVLQIAAESNRFSDMKLPRTLTDIENVLKKYPDMKLWFPVLQSQLQHEVALCIDFGERTISWADSLENFPLPRKVVGHIQKWLQARHKGVFREMGNTLPHGMQNDGISCIPSSINTIAHGVFGDALWSQNTWRLDRIRWFTSLVPSSLLQSSDITTTKESPISVVRPDLENLLNHCEDDAPSELPVPLPKTSPLLAVPVKQVESSMVKVETAAAAWKQLFASKQKRRSTDDLSSESKPPKKSKKTGTSESPSDISSHGPIGLSRSARSEMASRVAADRGESDAVKREEWKVDICRVDPYASFDEENHRVVICSRCNKPHKVKSNYNVSRFREHYEACRKKNSKTVLRLTSELLTVTPQPVPARSPTRPQGKDRPQPCPGLTDADNQRISTYLGRSAAPGGGSRPLSVISKELFGKSFRSLGPSEREIVLNVQYHERNWTNEHRKMCVYSTSCTQVSSGTKDGRILPCARCLSLLKNNTFQKRITQQVPADENYKYTNHLFRNQILGQHYINTKGLKQLVEAADGGSPFVSFATGVLEGKYKGNDVFLGLVQAMVQKVDHEERGVGMQNFTYAPAYDEFIQIVGIHSPRVHQFLSQHFPARSRANIRQHESRQPKLPLDICPESFKLVKRHLCSLQYESPVSISCDDSKLQPSLRLFWDGAKQKYLLVGAIDGPAEVLDADDIQSYMNNPDVVKGTKLRLWLLQIPLPRMCPIIIAALPIPENLTVPVLLEKHMQIIEGLINEGINVVSYACNGLESERSVQRKFIENAEARIRYLIPGPGDGYNDIEVIIACCQGKPVVMTQDAKHALKTARNKLFSGARLLPLGNFVATYQQVRTVAHEPESPLYIRDVDRLDRQDDNAASCLFSAATLSYLIDHHRQDTGLIVYLFVFGELCDAYQNRHISHSDRVVMVLRAASTFLPTTLVELKDYYISREFTEIVETLVNGALSLILVYRDYIPNVTPLLLWLHCTEPCEHVFGISRRIISDFTALDFYQMIPKLTVSMREALLASNKFESRSDASAHASGYHHTYLDTHDIDLVALARFPTNEEISALSKQAAEEAESLITLLGILPQKLRSVNTSDSMFFPPTGDVDDGSNSDHEDFDDADEDDIGVSDLPCLIQIFECSQTLFTSQQWDRLEDLMNAYLAITVDEQMRLQAGPSVELNDEIQDDHTAQDLRALKDCFESLVLETDDPLVATLTYAIDEPDHDELDLSALISIREQHQTRHAARSVRIQGKQFKTEQPPNDHGAPSSAKADIFRVYWDEVKKIQTRGITTGRDRLERWQRNAPGRESNATALTGNAANARAVATNDARKLATKRRQIFLKFIPDMNHILLEGGVSLVKPLNLADWGVVYLESANEVYIAQVYEVLAMYARGGGKNGKHNSMTSATALASLSHIAVQLFESSTGASFRIFPELMNPFSTKGFALLPPQAFLTTLDAQITSRNGVYVRVSKESATLYRALAEKTRGFQCIMKEYRKRTPNLHS